MHICQVKNQEILCLETIFWYYILKQHDQLKFLSFQQHTNIELKVKVDYSSLVISDKNLILAIAVCISESFYWQCI